MYWDAGRGDNVFDLLKESTTPDLTFTQGSVNAGTEYRFKMTARNVVGESNKSPELRLIASQLPGTPSAPQLVSADESP